MPSNTIINVEIKLDGSETFTGDSGDISWAAWLACRVVCQFFSCLAISARVSAKRLSWKRFAS